MAWLKDSSLTFSKKTLSQNSYTNDKLVFLHKIHFSDLLHIRTDIYTTYSINHCNKEPASAITANRGLAIESIIDNMSQYYSCIHSTDKISELGSLS